MTLFFANPARVISANIRAYIHKYDVGLCTSSHSLGKSVLMGTGIVLVTSVTSGCGNTCKNGLLEEGEMCVDTIVRYASEGDLQVTIGADVVNPIAVADVTGDGSDDVLLRINSTNQVGVWVSDDLAQASQTGSINGNTTLGAGNIIEIPVEALALSQVSAANCQLDTDAAREMLVFTDEFDGIGSKAKTFLVDQNAGNGGNGAGQTVTATLLEEETSPSSLFFTFQPLCFDANNDGIDEVWYNKDGRIFKSSVDTSVLGQENTDPQNVVHDDQLIFALGERSGDIFSFSSNILHDVDGDGDMDLLAYDASGTLVLLRDDGVVDETNGSHTAFLQDINGTDFNFGVALVNFGNDDTVEAFQVSSGLTFVSLSSVDVGHIVIENADAANPTISIVTDQKFSVSEDVQASSYQYTSGTHAAETSLFVVGNTYAQQLYPEIDSAQKTTLRLGNYFNLPPTDDGGLVFVTKIADVNADGSADILSDSHVYISTP